MSERFRRRQPLTPDGDAIRDKVARRIAAAQREEQADELAGVSRHGGIADGSRPGHLGHRVGDEGLVPITDLPSRLIAPIPPRTPQKPQDASAAPITALEPLAAAALPSGPIKATPPWGGAFGIDWSRITRFISELTAAHQKYPRVPVALGGSMIVIESGGLVEAINAKDGTGVPSYGLMQVKEKYWQHLEPTADVMSAAGNILLGFAVMDYAIRKDGSWQQAIAKTYHPGTDPGSGANPQTYVRSLTQLMSEWPEAADTPPAKPEPVPEPTPPVDPWRPYPYPPMIDLIVSKPGERAGFDRCALRRGRIAGKCTHITDGEASIEWYRDFFSTGGERAWDALTDFVLGRDGRLGLLNDWRDPNRGGTRAGWANGGVDGLEGIGIAFYRAFPAINEVLLSVETVARDYQPWTDAQIEMHIEMSVAIAQNEATIHHATYPVKDGVDREQSHYNFATKRCAGDPYRSTYREIIIREAKQKLAAWQGGAALPEPEPAITYTDLGLSLEQIAYYFGTMTRVNPDGTVDTLPFDTTGPLSLLWLKRCEEELKFPESEELRLFPSVIGEGDTWFATWEGGWTCLLPAGDTRASWVWADKIELPER